MPATVSERIWAKVQIGEPDECWIWTGGVGQHEHPVIQVNGRSCSPRRLVWEAEHGGDPLPRTRQVTTTCRKARCLNPKHLGLRAFQDDEPRFWAYVRKADGDGCWEWTGTLFGDTEYGSFKANGKRVLAHRYSWELARGPIEGHIPGHPEKELCVCHHCDNPRCVRPDHMFLGHDRDNNHDMIAKGRNSRGAEHAEKVRQGKANMGRLADMAMGVAVRSPPKQRRFAALPSDSPSGTEEKKP